MKIKRLAALLASAVMLTFPAFSVSADDTETDVDEEETQLEESDPITSEDGKWTYTIITDKENNDEYASIQTYAGGGSELDIPKDIDGNTVKSLGKYAFHENTEIKTVKIPETLNDFGNSPFFGCTSLEKFIVDSSNDVFSVTDKGALTADDGQLFVCCPPASAGKEYTVPDGVVALDASAFAVCDNIEKIELPDSLERINLYCFAECTSLDNVVVPDKVTELGMFAFTGCTSLKSITLPEGLETIGGGAFSFCSSLSSIEFPKNLRTIEQAAFVATGFTEIEIPATITEIGYSAFGYTADEEGQITPMESFTIKGYSGTMAQSYCGENENVTFVAIDDEQPAQTTQKTDNTENSSSGSLVYIIIAGVLGAAVIAAAVVCIVKTAKKRRNCRDDEVYDNDDNEDENEDEAGGSGQ